MPDHLAEAGRHALNTKIPWDEFLSRVRNNPGYNYRATEWYKAGAELEALKHPNPTPQPPVPSLFAGKGVFTTSEPGVCAGHPMDWVALQADPEGNLNAPQTSARICWWQARPTPAVARAANAKGIPYIGQAENQPEFEMCLAVGGELAVPHAIVGNPRSWTDPKAYQKALAQGWDLISEWYMNAHPWEANPDGGNYPRFVNACCGIYGEGEPGGDGYVKQIPLADYRKVWRGAFSVWKAEAMTDADWAVFAV